MNWLKKPWPKRTTEERRESKARQDARVVYMANLGREPEDYDEVLFLKQYKEKLCTQPSQ